MIRIGEAQARGYLEEDFQEAFQRYMSRSDLDALKATLQAGPVNERTEVSDQRSECSQQK
jgi:hypothetical protein